MPVFRFVRDLLGRKDAEPAVEELGLEELPALLDREEERVTARVGPVCEAPAQEIRHAVSGLEGVLAVLRKADWDMALHPKLEQISRTTLPAFVRAMDTCLARPLPEEPHEFYGAATAVLKCAVSALRGQGRYLRAVLPEEMKAIKDGIDVIGHAVNTMTTAFGEEKRDLARLEELRQRLERIAALEHEHGQALRRSAEAKGGLEALVDEETAAGAELERLNRSARAADLDVQRAGLDRLRARALALETAHRSEAQAFVQAFRRGERLRARRGERQAATRLHRLQGLLEEPLPWDEAALAPLLADGLAQVRDLVAEGEIAPKEEPASTVEAFLARAAAQVGVAAEGDAIERQLAASPVTIDRERLSSRLRQFEHRKAALEDERSGLARVAAQKIEEKTAVLAALEEGIGEVFSGRVRLRPPGA